MRANRCPNQSKEDLSAQAADLDKREKALAQREAVAAKQTARANLISKELQVSTNKPKFIYCESSYSADGAKYSISRDRYIYHYYAEFCTIASSDLASGPPPLST